MSNLTKTWFIALASVAGCVSLMAHGADSTHGAPRDYRARLVAQNCRLSTGEKVDDPKQVYYLALDEGSPVIIELDAQQDGVTIRNAWSDEDGQHFFAWVSGGPAYKFILPRDAGRTPQRLFYVHGAYEAAQDAQGRYRPVGRPAGSCDLVPGDAPAPAPSKPSYPSASKGGANAR